MGTLLLRFVTLGGSSSGSGDNDFSFTDGGGAVLDGDEDSKLITSFRIPGAGCEVHIESDGKAFNFAIALDFFTPGFVILAKLAIEG